jgi:hypothetical protein
MCSMFLSILAMPASVASQQSPLENDEAVVSLVAPAFERAPAGPGFIFHIRDDLFGVADPVGGKIVFVDHRGVAAGAAQLPQGLRVRTIDLSGQPILKGDQAEVVIPADFLPSTRSSSSGLVAGPITPDRTVFERDGAGISISVPGSGGEHPMRVMPIGPARVLDATFIGRDEAGRRYAYWEQVGAEAGDQIVGVFAGRFSTAGDLLASTRIDLSRYADIPAVPVAVRPDGSLLVMEDDARTVSLSVVSLDAKIGPSLSGTIRSHVLDLGDEAGAVRVLLPKESGLGRTPKPYDPAQGATIVERAYGFRAVTWTMLPDNFVHPAIPDSCNKVAHQYWKRPGLFKPSDIGRVMAGMPYKWGGFDSVESYKKHVSAPEKWLAGNVCTCRDLAYNQCIFPEAAGVDCSGFVSRAWRLSSHLGTSDLLTVSDRLSSLAELEPGDALDEPGSHVRLFVKLEPGANWKAHVLEAAVGGCSGSVCENTYSAAQLQRYRPIRFRG